MLKLLLAKYKKLKLVQIAISSVVTIGFTLCTLMIVAFMASLIQLDYGLQTAAILATHDKSDECNCYVKCTGDSDIDSKCTYELLFGPDKYAKLVKQMKKDINPGLAEEFDTLTSGKEIGEFIIKHLTQKMVYLYMDDLQISAGKRSTILDEIDGINRTNLSLDDLEIDLIKLLSDYKINGRNINCDCKSTGVNNLEDKCKGVKHWEKGWTWQAVYDNMFTDPDNPSGGYTSDDTYVIDVGGKRYFWFHQGEGCLTCINCGDWSRKKWGGIDKSHILANDGCAVYSLAMAVSNQLGRAVTPHELLITLGCTITDSEIDTSTSPAFLGRGIRSAKAMEMISAAYGLEVKLINKTSAVIDAELDKGAYLWAQWAKGPSGWYSGSGHYMVIRAKDANNYYRLDSTKANPMTNGATKSDVVAKISSSYMYSIRNPNPPAWGDGAPNISENPPSGGNIIGNVELYTKLSSDSRYSAKALALTTAYTKAVPLYGENFAVGLMANILAEGNAGQIEGMWVSDKGSSGKAISNCSCNGSSGKYVYKYWTQVDCGVHGIAGKVISSMNDINKLDSIPSGVQGIGVGCIQWSGPRRDALIDRYKTSVSGFSSDQLLSVEVQFMLDELSGGYKGVVNSCSGKSASDCASIICKQYEKPDNMNTKASQRARAATDLYNFIHS